MQTYAKVALLLLLGTAASTHPVLLQWTASTEPGVTYNVYRGTATGVCKGAPYKKGIAVTSFLDSVGVANGQTVFYDARAVSGGVQSVCAGEVRVRCLKGRGCRVG